MKKLLIPITLLLIALAGMFYVSGTKPAPVLGNYNVSGGGTYRLQSSVGTSDTSLTLTSFKEPVSNIAYTMSYLNSTIEYGTLEPQSNNKEFISFTGITQNSDGTATLTGVSRGLSFSYPFTASTTLQLAHTGQSIFILSNPPQLYNQFYNLVNVATSTNILNFSSTTPPRYDEVDAQGTGTYIATTSELASVAYVNKVALTSAPNGTATVKGVYQSATALQAASSTALGSTGASIVLTGGNATDTPQSGCATGYSIAGAGCSIIADLTGHIKQAWLDLTAAFTFVGNVIFSGTATFSSTATFNGAATFNGTTSGLDWQLVVSTTTTAATRVLQATTTTAYKYYKMNVNVFGLSSADYLQLHFNNDYTRSYNTTGFSDYTVVARNASTTNGIENSIGTGTTSPTSLVVSIDDNPGSVWRYVNYSGAQQGTNGIYPIIIIESGNWFATSSAQITNFEWQTRNGATIAASSTFSVWGSNN